MKQLTVIIGMAVTILIVTLSILSIESKSERADELNRAVSAAVKQTVEYSQKEGKNVISSKEEMVAEFVHLLFASLNNKGDIEIEVMSADYEEGLLDVEVTENFKYPNGKNGSVSVRKTAIYE